MSFEKVKKLLAEQLNIGADSIELKSRVIEDLGADSLDVVEMLMVLEDEFNITVTDEDGKEIILEFVDALEYNGQMYQAFVPAEVEGEDEIAEEDEGIVILKVIHEDGEDMLSTLDSEEEMEAVYNLFVEMLFSEEDE